MGTSKGRGDTASKLTHMKRRDEKNNILVCVCLGSAERTALLHTYRHAALFILPPLNQSISVVLFNFSTSYPEKSGISSTFFL